MSRFPELFEEVIEHVVLEEAFLIEELAAHIAGEIVERQGAGRAEARITARYPVERRTPVTGLATQAMLALIGIAAASSAASAEWSASRRRGSTPARARRASSASEAAERLGEAGFDGGDVERILELVPLATHNQRGRGTLFVGSEAPVNAEELVRIVEGSMSSPVYELLKRPDELFVVEHAHLQPRFVEDSVRLALQGGAGDLRRTRRRRFPLVAPGQPGDDPHARCGRRAVRHRRGAQRRAGRHTARHAHDARRLARPLGVYLSGTWYRSTQSLTVPQSRLAKKASMYDARSVW